MTPPSQHPLCLRCGGHTVRPLQRPARTVAYRVFAALPLPADFPIPTCTRCRAECLDLDTTQRLHALLPRLYQAELRRRAAQELRALSPHISQRQLELLAGLAQGYLSRLRAQAGTPSSTLVLLLALLARDPQVRLIEVQDYWRAPRPEPARLAPPGATIHPPR